MAKRPRDNKSSLELYIDVDGLRCDIDDFDFKSLDWESLCILLGKLKRASERVSCVKPMSFILHQLTHADRFSEDFDDLLLVRYGVPKRPHRYQAFLSQLSLPAFLNFIYSVNMTNLKKVKEDELSMIVERCDEVCTSWTRDRIIKRARECLRTEDLLTFDKDLCDGKLISVSSVFL